MWNEGESQQSQNMLVELGLVRLQRPEPRQNPNSQCLLVQLGLLGEARPLGKSATTKPELAESSSGAGRNWIFLVQSWWHDQSCRSPKISCQGKVEVVENIPQERNSERMGKQSRAMGVPKISCQENVDKIMKSFDARRETPSLFLDRFCERFGCEAAVAV